MLAEVETRQNGRSVVRMHVKTIDISLDEIGYEGWSVTMRTNPRSSVYDGLIALDDQGGWWKSFGEVVLHWNFADEDGTELPLPKDVGSEHDLDLPYPVIGYVFKRYLEAFRAAVELPKAPRDDSEPTLSISEESPQSV